MSSLPFTTSTPYTMGIELELQLINRRNFNLATDALDLLSGIDGPRKEQIKLEITQGMIELNSSVHTRVDELVDDLDGLRDALVTGAGRLNIDIAGGGAHPFQSWSEQRITPTERFNYLQERYGYLAKTFTVFGQHIHVGVKNGDDALYLTHGFSRYVPHFIALSAASPFYQGVDTAFDSARSNVVRAFPLAGTVPLVTRWSEFESYYDQLQEIGVIGSMKDFYWDIRPKPEYGTVEIRVCDTPLTIQHAALLGCYAQLLARWLLEERPFDIDDNFYLLYQYNRFEASRFGLDGEIARLAGRDQVAPSKMPIAHDILARLHHLRRYAQNEAEHDAIKALRHLAAERVNHATWLRATYAKRGSLNDLMRLSSAMWMRDEHSPYPH